MLGFSLLLRGYVHMGLAMIDDSTEKKKTPLTRRVSRALKKTKGGKSIEIKGAVFGRSVEKSIAELVRDKSHYILNVRQKNRAVVLAIDEYEALLNLRSMTEELTERYKALKLRTDGDKFDQMFAAMQTPESKQSVDDFFTMDEADLGLADAYKAGETENK
jgi:hypothetical protein